MRKKYINSNKTDVNTIYYRDKKGKILASSSTYSTTSEKKLSKFSLILGLLSLFVILSSMFLTGYVDSKYENSYVDEVKIIEYQKIVGYEYGNSFDFIQTIDDIYQLEGHTLQLRDIEYVRSNYDLNFFKNSVDIYTNLNAYIGSCLVSYSTDNINFRSQSTSDFRLAYYYKPYSEASLSFINNDSTYKSYNIAFYPNPTTSTYFRITEYSSYYYVRIDDIRSLDSRINIEVLKFILNTFYIYDEPPQITPIYETYFSYEYPTGYYDYDWNAKLEQLSKLRNVFNIGMIDFDKNLYYVNNYKYVRGVKNDGLQSTNYNLLFNDRNIQQLLPYCSVVLYQSWDEKIGSGKRDDYYLWYVYLNELDDNATDTQRKLWNYVKDNYITQYTLNNYINYYALKQYEGFYKFTQVLTFPINIINNLMYDFGVLIRFVVDW